jgi:hypothetical protein
MLVLCRHDTLVAWDLFRYDLSGTKRSLKLFPGLEFGYDTVNGYSTLDEAQQRAAVDPQYINMPWRESQMGPPDQRGRSGPLLPKGQDRPLLSLEVTVGLHG